MPGDLPATAGSEPAAGHASALRVGWRSHQPCLRAAADRPALVHQQESPAAQRGQRFCGHQPRSAGKKRGFAGCSVADGSPRYTARFPAKEMDMKIGNPPRTFQELIFALQRYWSGQGCVILQPYDMEMGAGTFHTATFLRAIGPEPWRAAYVQPSRRPTDGRYGENPFRAQHYYQYQVVIKPSPLDILELHLGSLRALGFDPTVHDIRFVEDNWESPTLGAWGLGWEVWLNGMEITQFTYFQQV